jgi:hypothetical protein
MRPATCAFRAGAFALALLALAGGFAECVRAQQTPDVPYVATPANVVDAMLDMARIDKTDFLVDLGSGDGRIVIEAAKRYGIRGMGVELDGNLVHAARTEARRQGVAARVEFVTANFFVTDFSAATVLTMYLFPHINAQLRPTLLALKPGTRIVSHDFEIGGWKPDEQRRVSVPDKPHGEPWSMVYLWRVPADVAGTWRWELPSEGAPQRYEAEFNQRFQEVGGQLRIEGTAVVLRNATVRGPLLSFTVEQDSGGRRVTREFSGRIEGDRATGKVTTSGGGETALDWQAVRVQRGKMKTD